LEGKRTIDLGVEQKKIFMERLKRDVNVKERNFYLKNKTKNFFFIVSCYST
jgi:hypothetical protein